MEPKCKFLFFPSVLGRLQSSGSNRAALLFRLDKLRHEFFCWDMFDQLASSRKTASVLEESWPHGRWLHLTTTHAEMCLEVVRLPSQTQARLRCDHAECVTKMPRSQWHLSQELKCLDSASINTNAQMHARASTARLCANTARKRNRLVSQTLWSTDEAVELPPEQICGNHNCSVHEFTGADTLKQMVHRRWGQEVHSTVDLLQNQADFRQNLA